MYICTICFSFLKIFCANKKRRDLIFVQGLNTL